MRLLEFFLHLPSGFLSSSVRLRFDPHWPAQTFIDRVIGQAGWGAALWTLLLIAASLTLVAYVYRREQARRPWRIAGAILRGALLLLLIALLNNPVIEQPRQRIEPSVLAVMLDKSLSMKVKDAGTPAHPQSRLDAARALLTGDNDQLLTELEQRHTVHLYAFDQSVYPLALPKSTASAPIQPARPSTVSSSPSSTVQLGTLIPDGPSTHLTDAIRSVLKDLQGQRLAAVVVLTDGRQTPAPPDAPAIAAIKSFDVRIDPVAVGTDKPPQNIIVQSMNLEDAAFVGDIVNVKIVARAEGFPNGADVRFRLMDARQHLPLKLPDGADSQTTAHLPPGAPRTLQLQFKPAQVGPLDVEVQAVPLPGELDNADNVRVARLQVLDAKLNVLYVDGYPRWDYRYIKTQMIRDRTINISCLLLDADPDFAQEGDPPTANFPGPITRFPDSLSELLKYDVVLFGDVDPRQFTDQQLQMLDDFVSRDGGGFEMVAGPRYSPQAWRGTPIEAMLPVTIGKGLSEAAPSSNSPSASSESNVGFRPILTPAGQDSGVFRFFADPKVNLDYVEKQLPVLFWYCRGLTVKSGVGQVLAEHPTDLGPDGKKAPLLVAGRFGAGRTLFCAFDGSWRWRFYTGESIFDTFWVQQIRHLARGRKLGQRKLIFTADRPAYELGEQVRLNLSLLDPDLQRQSPSQPAVRIVNADGELIKNLSMHRIGDQADQYTASFTADHTGQFTARLADVDGQAADVPLNVLTPRLELLRPEVDRPVLAELASQTGGQLLTLADARHELAAIPSAKKIIPMAVTNPLWDAPAILFLLAGLIIAEWITRKIGGMV